MHILCFEAGLSSFWDIKIPSQMGHSPFGQLGTEECGDQIKRPILKTVYHTTSLFSFYFGYDIKSFKLKTGLFMVEQNFITFKKKISGNFPPLYQDLQCCFVQNESRIRLDSF